MRTAHHSVPCKNNPLGVKGAGESGVAGSLPSAMNAVLDALASERHRAYRSAGIADSASGATLLQAFKRKQNGTV